MSLRNLKRLLLVCTVVCFVVAGGIVWLVVQTPLPIDQPQPVAQLKPPVTTTPATSSSLSDLQMVLSAARNKRLQRPIVDPPPPEPEPPKPPPPEPEPVKLRPPAGLVVIGTVIEKGRNFALLKLPTGTYQLTKEGSEVETLRRYDLLKGTISLNSPFPSQNRFRSTWRKSDAVCICTGRD